MARPGERRGPWRLASREVQYENPWITVREDGVVGPEGESGRFGVVEMKPGVCVLPLDANGAALLVRVFRYTIGRESLEAVSGGVDGDEPAAAAARRELAEEAGIEAGRLEPLGVIDQLTETVVSPCSLFLARDLSFRPPEQEATEWIEPVRMPLAEAVRQALDGTISHAATVVLLLKAARLEGLSG